MKCKYLAPSLSFGSKLLNTERPERPLSDFVTF